MRWLSQSTPTVNGELLYAFTAFRIRQYIHQLDQGVAGVKPDKVVKVVSKEDDITHTLYLWTTPLKKDPEKR